MQVAGGSWTSDEAYDSYKTFCEKYGYAKYHKAIQGFTSELRELGINVHRHTIKGVRGSYLELSDAGRKKWTKLIDSAEVDDEVDAFECLSQ